MWAFLIFLTAVNRLTELIFDREIDTPCNREVEVKGTTVLRGFPARPPKAVIVVGARNNTVRRAD